MVMPNPTSSESTDLETRLANLEKAFLTLVNVVRLDHESQKLFDQKMDLINAKVNALAAFVKLAPTPTKED